MLRTFTHPACLGHRVPPGLPERPQRLSVILDGLSTAGIEVVEAPTVEGSTVEGPVVEGSVVESAQRAVSALHSADYVERFRRAVERGDNLLDSPDNPLSAGTWAAAWGAVGSAVAACDWVMAGRSRRAFVAARPPGHHAERDEAMGFCYLGTAAAAAAHLVCAHGLDRVALFDFDVHHGNGSQHLLEERGDVLYVSVHQWPFYPGTGTASEVGRGRGVGATLNVPLPAGSGDEVYAAAIEETILPALESFGPQALVLSAGFDAWMNDPLGGMRVSCRGFERWGEQLGTLAESVCGGRVVAVLEGGYDLAALPDLVLAHLLGLDVRA